nr:hypothetical protein [Burkholderia pseudomallei]
MYPEVTGHGHADLRARGRRGEGGRRASRDR